MNMLQNIASRISGYEVIELHDFGRDPFYYMFAKTTVQKMEHIRNVAFAHYKVHLTEKQVEELLTYLETKFTNSVEREEQYCKLGKKQSKVKSLFKYIIEKKFHSHPPQSE